METTKQLIDCSLFKRLQSRMRTGKVGSKSKRIGLGKKVYAWLHQWKLEKDRSVQVSFRALEHLMVMLLYPVRCGGPPSLEQDLYDILRQVSKIPLEHRYTG